MSETQTHDDDSGLILWLSRQALPIRIASFIVFVVLIIVLIVGITTSLYYVNLTNLPRQQPIALSESISVSEFVTFEDPEVYPAAVASAANGTLFTGSYLDGTIWRVNATGDARVMPETESQIGSVIGLDVAADGTLYILDRHDPFMARGATIWRLTTDNVLETHITIAATGDTGITNPNDIAVTNDGTLFVLDIQRGQILQIADTTITPWWIVPSSDYQVAGLAYDPQNNSLFITDALQAAIYEIPVDATDTEAARTVFYQETDEDETPLFNGITVGTDGQVYVSALGLNEIWQIDRTTATVTALAGNYRGASDVAYDSVNQRLYINNWDQRWLQPVTFFIFQFNVPPRLPFSVDSIEWGTSASQ